MQYNGVRFLKALKTLCYETSYGTTFVSPSKREEIQLQVAEDGTHATVAYDMIRLSPDCWIWHVEGCGWVRCEPDLDEETGTTKIDPQPPKPRSKKSKKSRRKTKKASSAAQ